MMCLLYCLSQGGVVSAKKNGGDATHTAQHITAAVIN
jgi:hypothetical protein